MPAKPRRSPAHADWRVTRQGASVILSGRERREIAVEWFQDRYWLDRGLVVGEAAGRGAVLFVRQGRGTWVLRHYRRGGAVARLTADRYLWLGLERTRALREWRLLRELRDRGLPVPNPVAAHVRRSGPTYRGDIITERIAGARSLAAAMTAGEIDAAAWETIGATLRRFHDRRVDHADLNASNVLLDPGGQVFLVDFDRGALRAGNGWKRRNLDRLQRSLQKIARRSGAPFGEPDWRRLLRGYRSAAQGSAAAPVTGRERKSPRLPQ